MDLAKIYRTLVNLTPYILLGGSCICMAYKCVWD